MKITEIFKQNNKDKKTLISFEILPPLKGKSIQSVFNMLDKLMEFQPPFINVTYHRAEYKYKPTENNLYEKVYVRKRPGTVGICAAIMNRYPKVEAMPHLVCGGFSKMDTEDALLDLNYLGIKNVLLLRGDAAKGESSFEPEKNGNKNALELVQQANSMNKGVYLDTNDLHQPQPTDLCIGVAGYPEKHFEAPSQQSDLLFLKQKVDAGAQFIITQMFFDNQKYIDFVQNCRNIGINVPIIPGLKPLATKQQLLRLPGIFHINFPDELIHEVTKAKDDQAVKQIGVEWCAHQSQQLLAFGAPCLHFYTMSVVENVQKIVRKIM